jgi:hypothetical protein
MAPLGIERASNRLVGRQQSAGSERLMSSESRRRGSLFVIAAPSGAGKTSLVRAILERDPSLRVSVLAYHPQAAPHEVSGAHYHFIGIDEFKRLRDAGEFLENAQVFDNFYGTGRAQVEALRKAGHDVILESTGREHSRYARPCRTARRSSSSALTPGTGNTTAQSQDRQRRSHRPAPQGFDCRYVSLPEFDRRHRQ